jgi:hypothetical protein
VAAAIATIPVPKNSVVFRTGRFSPEVPLSTSRTVEDVRPEVDGKRGRIREP